MTHKKRFSAYTITLVLAATLHLSYGQSCQMEGVTIWPVPVSEQIWDWYRGEITNRATTNIEGITSVSYGGGLNRGPYLNVSLTNSRFIMSTNAEYPMYEEYETSDTMSLTISFSCTGGTSNNLVFIITVMDSNNNSPRFRPSDELEFTVMPPLSPGYIVTGCLNNIIVRDIDLTTVRIDYDIEENPYFELAYDSSVSTAVKEFAGVLKTKTFIRSLPEPIILTIYATDVDGTNDPPLTNTTVIRITSNLGFEMPEEPVFSQTFYLATYTEDDQVTLQNPISLQQGYDELVRFNLEGVYVNYFELTRNDNQLALMARTSLPSEILTERQIFLIVKAEREYTSGSSATIIIELPEDVSLGFERVHYTGSITDNNLILTQLILSQGYDRSNVSALVFGEHSSYFNAVVQGNAITVTMERLSENIISENNFIYLEIVASNGRTSARAVTTLEIVKDDNVTPVFNQAIYNGNYNPTSGFEVDHILIVQGFDDTVQLNLRGDYVNYFQIVQEGPAIDLTISALSTEIYSEGQIVLSIEASKPRTVGANAAIIITLPAARQLEFDSFTYRGTLQDNILILESIHLSSGYEESVNFELFGDYASYFNVTNVLNQAIVSLFAPLPNSIIENNNLIVLTINASDTNAVSTTASIVLDIIKDDTNTPVFNRNIYYASYTGSSIEIETINLIQGYDDSVTFLIDGVHAQYFAVSNTNNNVILSVQSPIPEDVIFNEKVLSFNVLAEKNLTVGGNAAVVISFPIELTDTVVMKFAQNTYIGTLTDDVLTMEDIILNVGYASGTEFRLAGDYSEYFILSHTNNVVSLTSSTTLPPEVIENNKFIVLEVEAQRERAVAVPTTVLIDIVKEDVIPLMFNQAYYRGVYTEETGLLFNEQISLSNGYDESVEFDLQGDYAIFFELVRSGNSLTLASVRPVTEDVLESHNQLLLTVIADRTNAFTGRSVISIDLRKENPQVTILRFTENSYMGSYDQGQLELPIITLLDSNFESYVAITGEHASYFNVSREANVINIELINELPMEVIDQNTIIILNLEAYYPNSISGNATIVIEIIKDSAPTTPVFDRAYYSGDYSSASGLLFEYTIQLVQGFDESVIFTLAGDDSQWFRLDHPGPNNLSLLVSNGEIQGIEDRTHLSFSIEANKPGSLSGNAAVIISLMDVSTVRILQFSQDFYTGTIENGSLIFDAMYLEGYASDITYSLRGDYANYFQLFNEAEIFTLNLGDNFPINDSSDVIILTLEAIVVNGIRAHATIIIDRVTNDDAVLGVVFEENYYVGSYSESDGLTFGAEIRLDGYATDISFSLSGDDSQWFELVQSGDTVTVIQSSTIPPSIVASNAQLIFVITAQRSGSSVASATIIITLTDGFNGEAILGFEQINYIGTIENQQVTIDPITLIQGFSSNVTFRLHGELEPYFSVTAISATVMIGLNSAIPETLLPSNGIIILDLQASAPQALTAYATIVFTIVTEEDQVDAIVELLFANTYYMGSYTASGSLVFEDAISLSQGYDASVVFALEGDQSQWFELITNENSATLRLVSPIPSAIVASNQQLIFVVSAQGTRNSTARATIVIALEDVFTGDTILGFERINYQGTIENNEATLEPITLIQGFSANVTFALRGELESYFALSHAGGTVSIALRNAIPGELIPPNGIIVLELEATAPQALTAYATIVFTIVTEEDQVDSMVELLFANTYYMGSYTASGSLVFEDTISLSQGYDASVVFALEGDQSQWFELITNENSATLRLVSPIPSAIVASNQQLIFVVSAQGTRNSTARATIVIALEDVFTGHTILGFERINYQGTIENNEATLEPITLIQGFSANVTFALRGELESYFALSHAGGTVSIALRNAIPGELIPPNGIIVLELEATAPQALTAYATIVFTIVTEEDQVDSMVELLFANTYYMGSYTASGSLVFEDTISLSQGYDASVVFALEGDQSQWFELITNENSATLRLVSPIPSAIVASNQQLIFVVSAQGTRNSTARATIVIALEDVFTGDTILGFERINYQGTIENNEATLEPITLIQGFSTNVTFALRGELESYFALSHAGDTVSIALRNAIPGELIPPNGIIVLELEATAPQALTAYATIVFTIVTEEDQVDSMVELLFANTYYMGSYTASGSLVFEDTISLSQGYDASVVFALEGDQSQWFELITNENSATLRLVSPIPSAIVASNQQLIFVVSAQGTRNSTARATIVIALEDVFTGDTILGFERINYQGTIENNEATLEPITLIQGFSANVTFALRGELESYFALSHAGGTVSIAFRNAIPGELIPPNGIIVLELEATAPQALTAYATIVFTIVTEEDQVDSMVELLFANTYYMGSYTASGSLVFEDTISLSQGYDASVVFALEGDQSQWFELITNENSATLRLVSPIPSAIVASNQQLIFVVSAQGTRNSTARATIVIALEDVFTGDTILGFERINYQGTIENNEATLEPITLIQGFSANVTFALRGELESYFALSHAGGTVSIALRNAIPGELIPPNGIIVLELEATAPQALTAYATIVFTIVTEEDQVDSMVELLFANTYYMGSYTASGSLVFEDTISLSQGYDASVVFALKGDQSQWFELITNENSATLRLVSPIPSAIVASNQQLIFVVSAQGTRNSTARATIVIALEDVFTGDTILGFERINYQGTIENNEATLEPITLIQGFSTNVTFALRGELESYFALSHAGDTVSIALRNAIPGELIPPNGIIVLELEATAPQALTAYATIVFTIVTEEDQVDSMVELLFANTYYMGSYTASGSLVFEDTISLSQGYDASVVFALEGDQSQWFELITNENSATLRLVSPIPSAIVASNQQLIFVVSAQGTRNSTARATIVIALEDVFTGDTILGFERINYQGTIENNEATLEPITLIQGFSANVTFALRGELESYFALSHAGGTVSIALRNAIPGELIPPNGIIVLELEATAPQALTAYATIVFTIVTEEDQVDSMVELLFANTYYMGSYTASGSLVFEDTISLSQGYDASVVFALEGDQSQWFELITNENSATLRLVSPIPSAIVASNQQLIFVVSAQGTRNSTARATIVIALEDVFTGDTILGFERINYQGTIENNEATLEPITLIQGFSANVTFALRGELESYFALSHAGGTVSIALRNAIPGELIPPNGIIVLELEATAPQALTAYATIVFTIVTEEDQVDSMVELLFANTYYMGSYTASGSLVFEDAISLSQGYDASVVFALEGDQSQWFELITNENSATLRLVSPIPSAIVASNQQLIFVVSAQGTRNSTARATIVIALEDVFTGDTILGFERINYQGTIENNEATLEPITLIQGFSANVTFALRGELESYFALSHAGDTVSIALRNAIPGELIPPNGIIVLELEATAPQALTAYATVVFTVITQESGIDSIIILEFADSYYTGSYSADGGFIFNSLISLSRGYDENVLFYLEGEQSQWFELNQSGNSLTLQLSATIPPSVVANYQKLLFVVTAQREGSISGRATVVISLLDDTQIGVDVYFEKNLYNGIVQNDIVQHESIKVRGFTGTNIEIVGEYASLFIAYVSEEVVVVQRSGLDAFPGEIPHVAIELHAGTAATVLILTVIHSGEVNSPLVTFSAPSYALRTDVIQTGLLGRVVATADNGEAVAYSLLLDNAHLQSRLSINSEGELYLSAPVNSGVYMFEVAATTVFTQATGTATVHLTVESLTVCGGDDLVVPPLIILDKDEEEPHRNLVVLDTTRHEGCWYSLTNRWPIDQNWLYVDDTGLHASSIDREHESIAFMALSQIQVELVLHCDTDNTVRSKRSLEQTRLGPYDYGNNKWVLTDTIQYNSRRSFVNLIVNDINDNAPIFVGKDQEPIAAGYPIPELIDTVVPRALAEVQATDADIGENAELLYWSNEPVLAVAPTTGFVHVRDGVQLEDGSRLAINATDRNGAGLTGSLDILVRLLDTSNIVVMTVQGAFLDDEKNITREISTNVGYEIKVLRSAVISVDVENEPDNLRMKRDTDPSGASLQLYIYGLIAREPVSVERLTTDINNIAIASVSIISTVSLEDYLEGREICVIPGRDTGLLVATIILSILLFIILVLIGVWYFLKWRKENYDKFSDENSLTSRNESFGQLPKPVAAAKPWLNIEDLKKSERRLQEMLNAPIEEVTVEPSTSKNETPYESILDLPPPDSHVPIVIQSIDKLKDPEEDSDDDEFGEGNKARRKSVVTFNENVEKIIHVEDDEDTGSHLGYEIYKL